MQNNAKFHLPEAPEPQRWRAATQALGHWVLPEFDMRCAIIDQRLPVAAP